MRIAAALLCLLCVACPGDPPPPAAVTPAAEPAPSPSTAAADPTLRWAIGEPTSLVPIHAVTPDDLLVVDALYDGLTRWDENLRPAPSVARRWQGRDGGRTWRFVLRRGARFSDGSPVTAASFVRTWTALARSGAAHHHVRDIAGYRAVRSGRAPHLAGVRARGATILEVRLRRPVSEFPTVAAHPALAPMRPDELAGRASDEPIGNGPFRMAEPWAHGRFVRLRAVGEPRTADSLGSPVHEVVFTIADPVSAYIAYEQGAVDVATVPPGGLLADPPPAAPVTRYRGPGLLTGELPTVYLLVFNTRRAPFDTVRARRGVALALDRSRLVRDVFEANASPGWSAAPPVLPGGRRRSCLFCTHDPPRARRLLRAAGVQRLTLWISRGGDHEVVAERVRRDLAAVGVTLTVRALGFRQFQRMLARGEAGLYRFGWTADYPTLDNALRPLFHSSASPARGGANYGRYRNRTVDLLLDRAARSRSHEARLRLYRRVEDLVLARDQAVVPVATLRRRTVVADRIRNLTYGPMGTVNWRKVRIAQRGD